MTRCVFLISVLLSLLTGPARADAIDGTWCAGDGRSMTIDGPTIHTPTGDTLTGEYSRHAFRYLGAPGGAEEAYDVRMRLWSEDELRIDRLVDGIAQPQETWHRCEPVA
ncbi:MAG: hypothetical protein Kow0026_06770 [Oricola sp.]